jgi:hypothetical protein
MPTTAVERWRWSRHQKKEKRKQHLQVMVCVDCLFKINNQVTGPTLTGLDRRAPKGRPASSRFRGGTTALVDRTLGVESSVVVGVCVGTLSWRCHRTARGALRYGPVTLKRIGLFCFPIKHSTHTGPLEALCVMDPFSTMGQKFCGRSGTAQKWAVCVSSVCFQGTGDKSSTLVEGEGPESEDARVVVSLPPLPCACA